MDDSRAMMKAYANKHPASYWFMTSSSFYGLISLLNEVTNEFGWGLQNAWQSKALGAVFFGGAMLWVARRGPPARTQV
jgi:predicted ATPase